MDILIMIVACVVAYVSCFIGSAAFASGVEDNNNNNNNNNGACWLGLILFGVALALPAGTIYRLTKNNMHDAVDQWLVDSACAFPMPIKGTDQTYLDYSFPCEIDSVPRID